MDLIAVDTLTTPPVVGQTYLVETVVAMGHPVPVLGQAHDDAEFITAQRHEHVDLRFIELAVLRSSWPLLARLPQPADLLMASFGVVLEVRGQDPGRQLRPLPCLREMPPYPLALSYPWAAKLQDAYADAQVTCGRCPHKGLPVASLPEEEDGGTTCRGHGLRHDKQGRLIRMIVTKDGCRRADGRPKAAGSDLAATLARLSRERR